MKNLKNKNHRHSLLWWLILLITIIYGGFLFMVSLGYFDKYGLVLKHFNLEFFIITLLFTIIMSYRRARMRKGKHYLGPFLCSLLFAILTQFILFLASPLFTMKSELRILELVKMTIVYILPSLISFLLIRRLVNKHEIIEDNEWFNWHYYVTWVEMMSNTMTAVTFVELFFASPSDQSMLGIRGTVWAFYALVAGVISDEIEKVQKKSLNLE